MEKSDPPKNIGKQKIMERSISGLLLLRISLYEYEYLNLLYNMMKHISIYL